MLCSAVSGTVMWCEEAAVKNTLNITGATNNHKNVSGFFGSGVAE